MFVRILRSVLHGCPLQDGEDLKAPDMGKEAAPAPKTRSATVDLHTDTSLLVDISDALSEQEKVKFTVHTKVCIINYVLKWAWHEVRMAWLRFFLQTTLKAFKKTDFTSVRDHEEFLWLHNQFVENEQYAGLIVSTWPWPHP